MGAVLVFLGELAGVAAARRRISRELNALPDRYLADMGLDREGIAAYVASGWPWPPSPFQPRARLRPSLRGCG